MISDLEWLVGRINTILTNCEADEALARIETLMEIVSKDLGIEV
jgi:hypothetical protein